MSVAIEAFLFEFFECAFPSGASGASQVYSGAAELPLSAPAPLRFFLGAAAAAAIPPDA
eukprot:COSAG06_NODE_27747_length_587_cov_0.799180_2_plen_58_part_01